ncbi:MAG: hypothetical protein KDD82_09015, partial [Planctomycetes bacterium]|nr:hypothetical protein [Planctomycetota bacterium]
GSAGPVVRAQRKPQIRLRDPRCPFCHDAVTPGEREQLACNACRAWHHQDCWTEAGARCSACGSEATGLYLPSSGVQPALPPRGRGRPRLRRNTWPSLGLGWPSMPAWLRGLPNWIWGLAVALLVIVGLGQNLVHELLLPGEPFSPGIFGSMLLAAGSVWSAAVALWLRSCDPDDPAYLGLRGEQGVRTPATRAELARRFAQSPEHFYETGLSLSEPEWLDLSEAIVVCAERVEGVRQLLSILSPLSNDRLAPPVVLVVDEVSDEVLSTFAANAAQGAFAGLVIHAEGDQLREVARACGARVVRRGRAPRCRDVGRARLRVDRQGVDVVTDRQVVRLPYGAS